MATVCAHVAGAYVAHTVSTHCTVVLPVITHPAVGRELVFTGPVHPVYPVGPVTVLAAPVHPVYHVGPVGPVHPVYPVGPVTVLAAPVGPVTVLAAPVGPVHPVYPVGPVTVLAAPVGPVGQIFAIHTTHSSVALLYKTSHLYCSPTT